MKTITLPCLLVVTTVTLAAQATSSAELFTSESYQYGRFEARIQFAPGDGVVSSFFLWKNGSEVAGTFWNELDFEKVGADCHLLTNAMYGAPATGSSKAATLSGNLCGEFHTYAYEWTPDYIAWLVDEAEVRRETGAAAAAFAQNATSGMQIRFNIWPGDASFGGNFSPAILPVFQYIDWVQYLSYSNGAFQLAWREDFTAGAMPSGWYAGDWTSPKSLSKHTPSNLGFVDGSVVLSLTTDNAVGTAGAAPGGGAAATSSGGANSTGTNPALGGSGSASSPTVVEDDGGCRVSTSRHQRNSNAATVFLLVAAGAVLRRRKRTRAVR